MQPFTLLLLLPVLIGVAAYAAFHDVRNAAGAATLSTTLVLYGALYALDPSGGWTWLAGLLVLPLPVSLALGAVVLMHGRLQRPRRNGGAQG